MTAMMEKNVETYPAVAAAIAARSAGWELRPLAAELLEKAERYLLTERQAAVLQSVAQAFERQAERQRQAAELRAAGVRCPAGRAAVSGQVVSVKWHTSYFGRRESTVRKMIVRTPAGWSVWATVPGSLPEDLAVGDTVEFEATVEPSDRDTIFGFAKRPTKARRLAAAATEEATR
jgi:hypothetical protein